jgi:hypothetical protein
MQAEYNKNVIQLPFLVAYSTPKFSSQTLLLLLLYFSYLCSQAEYNKNVIQLAFLVACHTLKFGPLAAAVAAAAAAAAAAALSMYH